MKGIVFTLAAVFAIMIATIAISILLYFNYAPVNQYTIKFSSLNYLVHTLSSVNLRNFTALPLTTQIDNQYQANNQAWPSFYQDNSNNASNQAGPNTDSLLLVQTFGSVVNPNSLIAGGDNIYVTMYGGSSLSTVDDIPSYAYGYLTNYGNICFFHYTGYSGCTGSGFSSTNIIADLYYNNEIIYANKTSLVAANYWVDNNIIPQSGVVSSPMIGYDNLILMPVYVSNNAAETGIMGVYANNGTKAWLLNTGGEVNSTAIAPGLISAEVGNTVKIFSYDGYGTPLSLYNTPYPYKLTHIITYQGSFYVADSSVFSGIASYNNTLYYQSVTNYTYAKGNVNGGSWKTYMPPYVGKSLSNGQPVASQDNLYTLWSNGYLVDQNTYDGTIKWIVHIPYQGQLSPHMILAYGKLYVISGNHLLGFGVCPGYPNQSVMSNIATFYLDTLSSCADIMLNAVSPSSNAYIIVNITGSQNPGYSNGTYMYPYIMNFTGNLYSTGSYVDIPNSTDLNPQAGINGVMSLCTWYNIASLSDYYGPLIKGKSPPSNGNVWGYTIDQGGYTGPSSHPSFTVWSSSGQNIAYGEANTITFNSMLNNWSFACFTYDYPSQKAYYYFDGVQYPASITNAYGPASSDTGNLIIGAGENMSDNLKPGYSKVSVADLQIYSSILSQNQVKTLYEEGIIAPPIQNSSIVGWWPLGGDTNDYSGNGNVGFPFNVEPKYADYISPTYLNAYDVGVFKTPIPVEGGISVLASLNEYGIFSDNPPVKNLINAGVYTWK